MSFPPPGIMKGLDWKTCRDLPGSRNEHPLATIAWSTTLGGLSDLGSRVGFFSSFDQVPAFAEVTCAESA